MIPQKAEQLAVLWTANQPEVAAFLASVLHDRDVVDELLQLVAVKVVRNFDRYDSSRSFIAWAIGIAKNEVLAWRRKQATDRHRFGEALVDRIADLFEQFDEESRPERAALEKCLQESEGRGREAIELYYAGELKTADVAKEMSMAPGALRMLLCRTRESLRRCIERRILSQGGP